MKVQMLVSTMKTKSINDLELPKKNVKDAVIVNQFMPKEKIDKQGNYIMYSYNEKGVSKSRNRLLEHATGDIEVITDDDITFFDDAIKNIEKAYEDDPSADIIIFNLKRGDQILGSNKSFKYKKLALMSVCSCQITFRRKSIEDINLRFDEHFGIKAPFVCGEENIFLSDAYNKGLKIKHVPIVVNSHPEEETTGEIWNEIGVVSRGALMYRLFPHTYFMYLWYFVITKHKYYKKNFSVRQFIKLFNRGKREYKALIKSEKR